MTRPRARWTIALMLAGALLEGCIVPIGPGPGRADPGTTITMTGAERLAATGEIDAYR